MKDNTNPEHYKQHPSGIECIRITEHYDFNVGNAIKYLWRAGLKGGSDKEIEDLKKAKWYIDNKIKMLSEDNTHPTFDEVSCKKVILNELVFTKGITPDCVYNVLSEDELTYTIINDYKDISMYYKSIFKIHEPT